MKSKLKTIGIGNEGERNFFVFDKSKLFFSLFYEFLDKLGLERTGLIYDFTERKINLNSVKDIVEHTENNDFKIDIFYGDKKIYVIVRCEGSRREMLMNILKEIAEIE